MAYQIPHSTNVYPATKTTISRTCPAPGGVSSVSVVSGSVVVGPPVHHGPVVSGGGVVVGSPVFNGPCGNGYRPAYGSGYRPSVAHPRAGCVAGDVLDNIADASQEVIESNRRVGHDVVDAATSTCVGDSIGHAVVDVNSDIASLGVEVGRDAVRGTARVVKTTAAAPFHAVTSLAERFMGDGRHPEGRHHFRDHLTEPHPRDSEPVYRSNRPW